MLRGGFNYSVVGGADRYSKDTVLVHRNLSFETRLIEFNLLGEFYLFNIYNQKYSPYAFAGLAVYHFNPYTYDTTGTYQLLRPLHTEGQGLPEYPDRKVYNLNQFALPFGIGVRFEANDYVNIGFELGLRKLFTDYIDDVSTTYVDEQTLLNARGPLATELAYRGDELKNGAPYPIGGTVRGGPHKDWYYFTGVTIGFRLFDLNRSPFERGANKYKTEGPKQL